jgi:hypothetical protein
MGTPQPKKNSDKKTGREKVEKFPPRPDGQAPLLNLPDDATAASKTNKPMRHGTPKNKKHADKILPDNIC